jgi:hypothetical protein
MSKMAPDHRIKVPMMDLKSYYSVALPVFRFTMAISMSPSILANVELMSNSISLLLSNFFPRGPPPHL